MGTNYYMMKKEFKDIYKKMSDKEKNYYFDKLVIHVGKASAGWKFLFSFNEWINSYKDLINLLNDYSLYDEYGDEVSTIEFTHIVNSKQDMQKHEHDSFLEIDGYDFCRGEFR